ncbi:hypothetical protein, partial [Ruminococcus sp.]|uniref:hypothetical protein n=1 Tax=Ruminococcus sp. TaxID=41978 RepID=UPI003AB4B7E4
MPDRKNNYFCRILGIANTAAQKLRFCRVKDVENILNLCRFFYCRLFQVEFTDRSSHVATQTEVEQDSFLRGTARNLEKSDVVLSVIIY